MIERNSEIAHYGISEYHAVNEPNTPDYIVVSEQPVSPGIYSMVEIFEAPAPIAEQPVA